MICGTTAPLPREAAWEPVIGLEVHAQVAARTKLFSAAVCEFAAPVNSRVQLVDAAFPGTLPVLNERCVEAGILTALALGMRVNTVSTFDRKHYFYADMPAGYQITQQRLPLAEGGELSVPLAGTGRPLSVRLARLQLEQDSGKSLHDLDNNRSLIDLNRAGCGLMELVFEPDLRSGEEAAALVKELILILRRIGTCSCKMEEGALRVDANVSVRPAGSDQLGVRSEVKNIGSVRGVARAVQYEIGRQVALLESGGRVVNETRSYDPETAQTVAMRDKEVVQDYRFLPEPNLPPLRLSCSARPLAGVPDVDRLRETLPELPAATRSRLETQYRLTADSVQAVTTEEGLLEYFEATVSGGSGTQRDAEAVAVLLRMDVKALLNERGCTFADCPLSPSSVGEIFDLRQRDAISSSVLPLLLEAAYDAPMVAPSILVAERGWSQISDQVALVAACDTVLRNAADKVAKYRAASPKKQKQIFNQLAKDVRLACDNRANMAEVSKILREKLESRDS
ncbi:Glutamyl-tRNA(Gln) amidotransferase subunit B, mitochondrial [Amphibalanus amphitrite]|uniref:Glutamyl-tRNA(Gln) amidotransferase subunit B, mitochondrial n=1 Tax=Amphibalanus amphitrite TaxID=1232801 RepID=A0A6A4W329_AMPAM|nr:Glutamyl-tRNA(Gln) amidotransferase subunit B, mitochondrial [Amphibalanus amphitrite]